MMKTSPIGFHMNLGVNEGYLRFLMGLLKIFHMEEMIILNYITLSIDFTGKGYCFSIKKDWEHFYLPFEVKKEKKQRQGILK